ncbi:hypothetical protein DICVIV_09121 [Dictyocaulus viviparus]|uniref:Resistance to inhibitors of cholinesterase protein 3 N-terminal domain-containing protein n=1 Tax=Dictyocaulus viviparus TaxID=29172 RepID=A0A0D8XJT8_DICVI|nr:hypothetical protein DICVIV_09121 [Dictyocaulus viviparus]
MPDRGRERERKRRRRRSFDEDDNGFSGWKLGLVVGVIVVCFAMLYPTVLHPMLMSFFGRSEPAKAPRPSRPPVHPGMGGPGGGRTGGRHDVHPAMKMAQQQAESHSSGRGMFTWMLPLYTIGVVIFLLYTLFKSKNRRKRRSRYDSSEFSSDEDEYNDRLTKRLVDRLGKKKLRGLQERLQQTEEAMTKILEQLEAVQAAGALIEGEQGLKGRKDDPEKSELLPQVDAKNEQYINDLEKALKDFKVLSEAYEEEKSMIRRKSRSEEDETSSEELHSESSEDVEEPEEKTKEQTKIELVDESEEEYFSKENETKSLIDKECVENESAKPIAKNVRRRAKKL